MNLVVANGPPVTKGISGHVATRARSPLGVPRLNGPAKSHRPVLSGASRLPVAARLPPDRPPDRRNGHPRARRRTARGAAATSVSRHHRRPAPNPAC